jgi:hypothetical protein
MAKENFDGDPGALIGDAIFSVIKPLYKEGEKQKRQRNRPARRTYYAPIPKTSQKDIVFEVLPQAITHAGTTFNARDLYYATRALAYNHCEWEGDKTLNYTYFSQQLLTEFQEMYGSIAGLWRDARGHLHEPHTGNSVALGTREIAAYEFPEYTFDKILYVEKEGELPKLQAAGWPSATTWRYVPARANPPRPYAPFSNAPKAAIFNSSSSMMPTSTATTSPE